MNALIVHAVSHKVTNVPTAEEEREGCAKALRMTDYEPTQRVMGCAR